MRQNEKEKKAIEIEREQERGREVTGESKGNSIFDKSTVLEAVLYTPHAF